MTRVVLDAATAAKLHGARDSVELCDESGRVLGRFVPAENGLPGGKLPGPQISEEELDRRERAGGGRSLAEILADLEKRP